MTPEEAVTSDLKDLVTNKIPEAERILNDAKSSLSELMEQKRRDEAFLGIKKEKPLKEPKEPKPKKQKKIKVAEITQ